MSFDPTDPSEIFGGVWERIVGRFLLAACEEYPVDSIGGEATHTLTIAEMPSHNHLYTVGQAPVGSSIYAPGPGGYVNSSSVTTTYTGGGKPHNNMPPYLAVYMWRRVG